jgi:ligand-binding SRPBCC domain-containing protein
MTEILLNMYINATAQVCYDLSRSIDLHQVSTAKTKERAIAGRTSGLMEASEFVTWEAIHFGIKQNLTVRNIEMKPYTFFNEEMIKGAFKSMYHEHYFEEKDGGTLMSDIFRYETPGGMFGKIFDKLVLKAYMTKLLVERNDVIKEVAETGEWKKILR